MSTKRIAQMYENLLDRHGDDQRSLAYGSRKSRYMRYWCAKRLPGLIGDSFDGSSVLDMGCGLGNFAQYLDSVASYVGVDITEGFVKIARERCQIEDSLFLKGDAITIRESDVTFDWVFFNGTFSNAYSDNLDLALGTVLQQIEAGWSCCKKGLFFDLTRGETNGLHTAGGGKVKDQYDLLVKPEWIMEWAHRKGRRVIVDTQVSDNFFGVYMYKEENLWFSKDMEWFEREVKK